MSKKEFYNGCEIDIHREHKNGKYETNVTIRMPNGESFEIHPNTENCKSEKEAWDIAFSETKKYINHQFKTMNP